MAILRSKPWLSRQPGEQRIPLVSISQLDDDQAQVLERIQASGSAPVSLVLTLAHYPSLLWQVLRMAREFQAGSLAAAERELVILNVAAFCRSGYLFAEHSSVATESGLTQDDLAHIWNRSMSISWNERQIGLISFTNELLERDSISNSSWNRICLRNEPTQLIELISLTGFYRMIAVLTNAVEMDPGDFEHHTKSATEGR